MATLLTLAESRAIQLKTISEKHGTMHECLKSQLLEDAGTMPNMEYNQVLDFEYFGYFISRCGDGYYQFCERT